VCGRLCTQGRTSWKRWWVFLPHPFDRFLSLLPSFPTTPFLIDITGNSSLRGPSLCSCWTEWADGLVWGHVYPVQYLCRPGEKLGFTGGVGPVKGVLKQEAY
jgi:hypothetical protein